MWIEAPIPGPWSGLSAWPEIATVSPSVNCGQSNRPSQLLDSSWEKASGDSLRLNLWFGPDKLPPLVVGSTGSKSQQRSMDIFEYLDEGSSGRSRVWRWSIQRWCGASLSTMIFPTSWFQWWPQPGAAKRPQKVVDDGRSPTAFPRARLQYYGL